MYIRYEENMVKGLCVCVREREREREREKVKAANE
jgi:hypothetical protein